MALQCRPSSPKEGDPTRLIDMPTPAVNRSAIVMRPRKPYLDWTSSLDGDAGEHSQRLEGSSTVHLAPEVAMMDELDEWLEERCDETFERA